MTRHILHTLVQQDSSREARHLLLDTISGPDRTVLTQMLDGVETEIATGTEYEMGQKATGVAQQWITAEGFRFEKTESVFDCHKNTIALAAACGFTVIYDPQYHSPRNFTGVVSLAQWPGMAGRHGENYEYAFDGITRITARPALPPNHGLNLEPKADEFLAVVQRLVEIRNAIGPTVDLLLAGNDGA